jgi:tetratricopeptide (TPR) repeat protein
VLARVVQGQWASAGGPLVDGVEATDDVRAAILARFRENLVGIVAMAQDAGVAVYVLPTPPHLTYPPFMDAHDPGLSNDVLATASRAHAEADAALRGGDAAGALDAAERAVSADPAHGGAWFVQGIAAGQLGEHDSAVEALEHALARDISHKRTDPGFAVVAAEVCAETGGCVAGDAHTALRARARTEGIAVYDELLGDHEHLNPAGNAWVAAQIAALIVADAPPP